MRLAALAGLLCALPAWAADRAETLASVDRGLARAAELQSAVESCLTERSRLEERARREPAEESPQPGVPGSMICRADFPIARLEAETSWYSEVRQDVYPRFPLHFFNACMAYATGDASYCARLDAYDSAQGLTGQDARKSDCTKWSIQSKVAKAAVSGEPPLETVCRALAANEHLSAKPVPMLCSDMVRYPDDPEKVCRLNVPRIDKHTHDDQLERCIYTVGALVGKGKCKPWEDDQAQAVCETARSYRRAYAAHDTSACGGSVMCEVMMGGGAATCRSFLRRAREGFCGWAREQARLGRAIDGPMKVPGTEKAEAARLRLRALAEAAELEDSVRLRPKPSAAAPAEDPAKRLAQVTSACADLSRGLRSSLDEVAAGLEALRAGGGTELGRRLDAARELRAKAERLGRRSSR